MTMDRRAATAALLLLALPLRAADAAGYSVTDFDWLDAARARAVPVRLYLPDDARAAQPAPLVVFSHGIGGSRQGYSYLGRHFASQGLASLHLQHVGSDRTLWSGNPFAMVGRLQGAAQDAEAIARVQDLRFALDQLLGGDIAAKIDPRRIAAAGHSYGANTSLLAAGAQVERDGRTLDLRDPRVKAAIVISAPPFYGEAAPEKILAAVTVPTLHVTATEDVIRIPGYYSGAEDRVRVFDATGGARKTLAVFAGGSHSVFTDRVADPVLKDATKVLAVAFLHSAFDGDDTALALWPQRFAGLLARFTPALAR